MIPSSHTNSVLAFGFQGSDKDLNNKPTSITTKKLQQLVKYEKCTDKLVFCINVWLSPE
jgi:hypothetical protein